MVSSHDPPVERAANRRSLPRRLLRGAWDLGKVVLLSAMIIIPIRAYVAQPFFVRGASMDPSFLNGEYLIIEELSFTLNLREPARGDVVVFRYPLDQSQHYIKRVVGLPNERVVIRDGRVTVMNTEFPDGVVLDEPYLSPVEKTSGDLDATLRPNEYVVLGDNRDHSSDSRAWGPVPGELLVGRAWLRVFPVARAGALESPRYGGLVSPLATAPPASE